MKINNIAIVGLGYVGLPLAVAFGRHFETIGYDIKTDNIESFKRFKDPMGELTYNELKSSWKLTFTDKPDNLSSADFIIIATPTPIDGAHRPDLTSLISATKTVGNYMKRGAIVIFESTVYPGLTEDICVPVLEKSSGYIWQKDFFVGYSPERINPGDKKHTLENIVKIVAGDNPETLQRVTELYNTIINAGIYQTSSIKEAEAAKVIENTQRDLNIALMNEFAVIFDKMGIDTLNVLEAAGSKWNFLPFRPGLVGGHCIGVDPYYLTYKAETLGYHPQVILAGRRINDSMGKFIAEKTVKFICKTNVNIRNARVAIFGITFKENCADIRNTRVVDIIEELRQYGINPIIHDPIVDSDTVFQVCGTPLCDISELANLNAIILAVAHDEYQNMKINAFQDMLTENGCLIDVKGMFDDQKITKKGIKFWRL